MNKDKTLLFVSDNDQHTNLLKGMLSELDVRIVACSPSGQIAAHLQQHQPSLVLLAESGMAQLADISDFPVLLLTKGGDSVTLGEFIDRGVADFIFTGLQKSQVLQVVTRQLALIEGEETRQRFIRQTLKLEELGELVGLVSHEVASPLGNVSTAVSFLLESGEKIRASFDEKKLASNDLERFLKHSHKALTMCVKNGSNAGSIISSFRTVASNQCMENLNQFYLHRYLDDIVLTLKSKMKKLPHEIHIVIGESVEMTSYSGVFSQVITGLINKSIVHAFDNNIAGKIIINAAVQTGDSDGDKVVLNYIDNGNGMDQATLEGLLLKRSDITNNGLTTAMLKCIVEEQMQGTMQVSSSEGEGIHCTLVLPQRLT
ncbi:MAG: ATP-binding protein [Psychrosphaera sp.]|nr:ATP-binding protein [Psychrosphaera sp.]